MFSSGRRIQFEVSEDRGDRDGKIDISHHSDNTRNDEFRFSEGASEKCHGSLVFDLTLIDF